MFVTMSAIVIVIAMMLRIDDRMDKTMTMIMVETMRSMVMLWIKLCLCLVTSMSCAIY